MKPKKPNKSKNLLTCAIMEVMSCPKPCKCPKETARCPKPCTCISSEINFLPWEEFFQNFCIFSVISIKN
jgi:hypothetical protein